MRTLIQLSLCPKGNVNSSKAIGAPIVGPSLIGPIDVTTVPWTTMMKRTHSAPIPPTFKQGQVQFDLIPGELELCRAMVSFNNGSCEGEEEQLGLLVQTNFQLMFKRIPEDETGKLQLEEMKSTPHDTIHIALGSIARVTVKKEKVMELQCKDFRNPRIVFLPPTPSSKMGSNSNLKHLMETSAAICDKFYDYINKFAFPERVTNLFAFDCKLKYVPSIDGWNVYQPNKEYARIFVNKNDYLQQKSVPGGDADNEITISHNIARDGWRISDVNRNYVVCPTYPSKLVVPIMCQDNDLKKIGNFRSKGRLPALSWKHPKNNASLTRCSQPKIGVSGRVRNAEDEELLRFITIVKHTNSNPMYNTGSNNLFIMDARPRKNAVANQATGQGGSETHYDNVVFDYLGIENIHVMRDSLTKLRKLCMGEVGDDAHWLSQLESTHWMHHILLILQCAFKIANLLDRGSSVLVHCSDGWDRSSQLTSLAMLLLDPYYRTIQGFEVLIEKEWISFGHKFNQRIGHGQKNFADNQRAPIFLQFLDCVFQLMKQFPTQFEFNESFLITIMDAVYSCQFGTFLANCESEAQKLQVRTKTPSVWSWINSVLSMFLNLRYSAESFKDVNLYNAGGDNHLLKPKLEIKHLTFWRTYYMRYIIGHSLDDSSMFSFGNANRGSYNMQVPNAFEVLNLKYKISQLEEELSREKQLRDDAERLFSFATTQNIEQWNSRVVKRRLKRSQSAYDEEDGRRLEESNSLDKEDFEDVHKLEKSHSMDTNDENVEESHILDTNELDDGHQQMGELSLSEPPEETPEEYIPYPTVDDDLDEYQSEVVES